MGFKELWTSAVQAVTGYKDINGSFYSTKEAAERASLQSKLVQAVNNRYYKRPSYGYSTTSPSVEETISFILDNFTLEDKPIQNGDTRECKCT